MLFYLMSWYAAHDRPLPLYRELGAAMGMTKNGVAITIWTFKQLGLLETTTARPHHATRPGTRALIAALE